MRNEYKPSSLTSLQGKNIGGLKFLRHSINIESHSNQYHFTPSYQDYSPTFRKNPKGTDQSDFLSKYRQYKYSKQIQKESNEEAQDSPIKKLKSARSKQRVYTQSSIPMYLNEDQRSKQIKLFNLKDFTKKNSNYEIHNTYQDLNSPIQKVLSYLKPQKTQKIINHNIGRQRKILEPLTVSINNKNAKKEKVTLKDFSIGRCLGQGKFGNVYISIHKSTGAIFALKKVKKQIIREHKLQNQFMMEIKMQLHFKHKNILNLYGFFDDEDYIYLILQYMEEGSLSQYLKKRKVLTEQDVSKKMRQIIEALDYLHSKNIAHRDLKPENIVISNGVCKLCDFGWSVVCGERRRTLCGTLDYICPQVLKGQSYGTEVDLWCIGVLCYQLLVGKAPFYHIKMKQTMIDIIECDLSKIKFPNTVSSYAQDFVMKMMVKEGEMRMTTEQALKHQFIQIYKEEQQKKKKQR